MPLREFMTEEGSMFAGMTRPALLASFRSFEWNKCLKPSLGNLSTKDCLALLRNLNDALPEEKMTKITVPLVLPSLEDVIDKLRKFYKLCLSTTFTSAVIAENAERAWSAYQDDVTGWEDVSIALDIVYIQD